MRKFKIKIATLAFSLAIMSAGCSKFLDVNDNPNQPLEADVKLLLPSAAAGTAHVLSNQLGINAGIWAQYWTQSPFSSQYKTNDRYQNTTASADRPWSIMFSGALQDYQNVINNHGQYTQHAAIAYMLKAYTYQIVTDAWGDVPLRGALKGGDSLSIAYDAQSEIYDSIITWIDKGVALVDVNSQFKVASEDLIFKGDMTQWLKFANTLKLKVYLRLSQANAAKAQAGVFALQGKPFLDRDALIAYATTGGNENPMFAEILGLGRTQNLVASRIAVNAMTRNLDPRRKAFYTVVKNVYNGVTIDTIVGIRQGSYPTTPPPGVAVSFPSATVGGLGADNTSAQAPVRFISLSESYFLQSEAVARGWMTGTGTAETLFKQGITASFTTYNLGAEAAGYIATAPDAVWPANNNNNAQIKAIITQKYYAMNGNQTFEAWTEWRRTGFPDFFELSQVGQLQGKFPARYPYPDIELTTNGKFPGTLDLDVPVWWDK